MHRRTVVVAVLVVALAVPAPAAADRGAPDFAGDDCTVETADLQETIRQWATGSVTTQRLQTAIRYWATGQSVPDCDRGRTATVVEVVDGDTLAVRYGNGTTDTVRLLGVDTPEVHVETDPAEFEGVPDTAAGHDWLRGWGENASAYVRRVVGDGAVRLTFDDQSDRRGTYGRLLAYVRVNESFVLNAALVERGYARVYTAGAFERESAYLDAEATARQRGVGVWAFEATTADRANDTGSLVVERIHADAEGNDNENENGEYVVFRNAGDAALDLSGWTVADAVGHTYAFPSGFTLDPGATVTLFTGSGTDTGTELYWGSDSAIWNNGGDTIVVTNADGETILRTEYS